ncbi:MAG: hypothetical protein ABDH21_01200 [bacterium]
MKSTKAKFTLITLQLLIILIILSLKSYSENYPISTYNPKNYVIQSFQDYNTYIQIKLYSNQKNYELYIFPLYPKENKNIDNYLKTLDIFFKFIESQKQQSFKTIYMFEPKKIYIR